MQTVENREREKYCNESKISTVDRLQKRYKVKKGNLIIHWK